MTRFSGVFQWPMNATTIQTAPMTSFADLTSKAAGSAFLFVSTRNAALMPSAWVSDTRLTAAASLASKETPTALPLDARYSDFQDKTTNKLKIGGGELNPLELIKVEVILRRCHTSTAF